MTQALNFFIAPSRRVMTMPDLTLIFTETFEGTLGDFTIYLSSAQTVIDLTTVDPIAGSQSARIARASGTSVTYGNVVGGPGSSAQVTGRLRGLGKRTESSSNSHQYGLVCMQSAGDLTGGSGSAYGLRWRGNALDLIKTTAGLAGFGTVATTALTQGTGVNAIQLDWVSDQQAMLGGTALTGWYGTATDFSDLTEVLSYTDSSSPLTSTVNQGFFGGDFGNGNDFRYVLDTLSLYGA